MEDRNQPDPLLKTAVRVMLGILALGVIGLMLLLWQTPIGAVWSRLLDALFAISSTQVFWFITRAAGIVAYLLLWLSTVWGLAVSPKLFDVLVPRAFTYDAHEFLSLLALAFVALHVVALLFDAYTPFTLAQLGVPFLSDYRPFWTGLGILAAYASVLVTVTFYIRKWIGIGVFRVIHYVSFAAYFFVTLHSWFAGTDTGLFSTRLLYAGSALSGALLTLVWLVGRSGNRQNRGSFKQKEQKFGTGVSVSRETF